MQTYHKIWMHFVWSTKKRERIIRKDLKQKLIYHLKENGGEKGIYIDTTNGDMDHMHLLMGLTPTQAPSEIANLIKGESSHWVNSNDFIREKFVWQRGFAVFSVSESQVGKVRRYIKNQEEHHRKKSFREELDSLLQHHDVTP